MQWYQLRLCAVHCMTPVCFLAGLLQQAPFHLDSLLAMYDLYRWVDS
jgi:hypothetical protein